METRVLVEAYYDAFNDGESDAMLALMTDEVAHDVNQGERRIGKEAFRAFNAAMTRSYAERLSDIVVMVSEDGKRASAEFTVNGFYVATAAGLPEAENQRYRLPAGTFFAVEGGLIARVTTYYNLADWLKQVDAD